MKLSLFTSLNTHQKYVTKNVLTHFFSSTSTKTQYKSHGLSSLYRRISPIGDPNVSVVPELDQWIEEGKSVDKPTLERIITELRKYKRFKHALEVSQWMTDKRYFPITPADASARLLLISRVHGLKEAEIYFNNIPQTIKDKNLYVSLLNCYSHGMSVEKAEALMQKAKDLGYARTPLCYNIMMNLYYKIGDWEKLDNLMGEMKEKGMYFDKFTLTIRLSAYAAAADAEGVDKIVNMMESDTNISLDSETYAAAAKGYLKVGLVEKALATLKKIEEQMSLHTSKSKMFDLLLHLYAEAGRKDELYRIWNIYKQQKIFNKGYIHMMGGLIKFGDIEGAEKLFEEWHSKDLSYDFRVPNFLIDAYCKNGDMAKAEALLNKGIARGGGPLFNTWYYLASGYIMGNQVQKAVDALKKAILICPPNYRPSKDSLNTCVEYLETRGDSEKAEKFMTFLKEEGLFSPVIHEKLLTLITEEN